MLNILLYCSDNYVSWCYCDNNYGKYGTSTCAAACPGNIKETCGGYRINSVYSTQTFVGKQTKNRYKKQKNDVYN